MENEMQVLVSPLVSTNCTDIHSLSLSLLGLVLLSIAGKVYINWLLPLKSYYFKYIPRIFWTSMQYLN